MGDNRCGWTVWRPSKQPTGRVGKTGNRISLGSQYGNPTCAVIAAAEMWCAVGGAEGVAYYDSVNGVVGFLTGRENVWVAAMREEPPGTLRILADPSGDDRWTWELDTATFRVRKISDGLIFGLSRGPMSSISRAAG
jgi:hypothetical protein